MFLFTVVCWFILCVKQQIFQFVPGRALDLRFTPTLLTCVGCMHAGSVDGRRVDRSYWFSGGAVHDGHYIGELTDQSLYLGADKNMT